MFKLIVVESPSKARTIGSILKNKNFKVLATGGHIFDLPIKSLGVSIENNFEPEYVKIESKKKFLKEIYDSFKKCDEILIATDDDREGEGISYLLAKHLKIDENRNVRVVLHEITEKEIKDKINNPLKIDINKVNAQRARRILDRLFGYLISPVLWKWFGNNSSAGRVQSVVLKEICNKEDEIRNFISEEYIEIEGFFENDIKGIFKDGKNSRIKDKQKVEEVKKLVNNSFVVNDFKISKEISKSPNPFKTSTLQQVASNSFKYSPKKTMSIAQSLYEGIMINKEYIGLITYMRTDSLRVSDDAKNSACLYIKDNFGSKYIGKYVVKKSKHKIQDAHEAIRPTKMLNPDSLKLHLSKEQFNIYQIIFNQFVASQMADMIYEKMSFNLKCDDFVFSALTQKRVIFEGYQKILSSNDDFVNEFPNVDKSLVLKKLDVKFKKTSPPSRYSHSTLIKLLEKENVGRPSTYATILDMLESRDYVLFQNRQLIPTNLGYSVKNVLDKFFPNIMNLKFTSNLEDQLDKLENGECECASIIRIFYSELKKYLDVFSDYSKSIKEKIFFKCDKCNNNMEVKTGRFGAYLSCENDNKKYSLKSDFIVDSDINLIFKEKEKIFTDFKFEDKNMELKNGKFGYYLFCLDQNNQKHFQKIPSELKINFEDFDENKRLKIKDQMEEIYRKRSEIEKNNLCSECNCSMKIKEWKNRTFLVCPNYPKCKKTSKI